MAAPKKLVGGGQVQGRSLFFRVQKTVKEEVIIENGDVEKAIPKQETSPFRSGTRDNSRKHRKCKRAQTSLPEMSSDEEWGPYYAFGKT